MLISSPGCPHPGKQRRKSSDEQLRNTARRRAGPTNALHRREDRIQLKHFQKLQRSYLQRRLTSWNLLQRYFFVIFTSFVFQDWFYVHIFTKRVKCWDKNNMLHWRLCFWYVDAYLIHVLGQFLVYVQFFVIVLGHMYNPFIGAYLTKSTAGSHSLHIQNWSHIPHIQIQSRNLHIRVLQTQELRLVVLQTQSLWSR